MIIIYKVYKVVNKDTIDSIAQKFNISVEELLKLNGLDRNTKLTQGMFIVVPASQNNYSTYLIQKGDTLYSIAKNNNISLNSLLLINGFDANEYIYPGEEILIPKKGINILVTNDGDTIEDLVKYGLNNIIDLNSSIYLLPNQIILYSTKEQ